MNFAKSEYGDANLGGLVVATVFQLRPRTLWTKTVMSLRTTASHLRMLRA